MDSLLGSISAIFQVVAWLWAGVAAVFVLALVTTVVRSRHGTWVRKEEIVPPARVSTPIADPESKVA